MSEHILFTCPLCSHQMRLPSKYIGKKGKCAGCSEKVVVVNSSLPAQPTGSDSILYEPAADGTYLLHRISEQTPDSPLSHLTFTPGTFDQDGQPYYFMTSDGESGFLVYEGISGIDGNDQVLLVIFMPLDISYADVSQVYDAFTILQDNTAYECSSSWMVDADGDLGLKTSVSLLPLMGLSTRDLQLHVDYTIQLLCGRVGEFCDSLSANYEAGNFDETDDSVDTGEVVGKILKFGLDVFLS